MVKSGGEKECSGTDVFVFVVGLVSGTGCSLTSKMLLTCVATGKTGELEEFTHPLFQSWVMFVAMTFALPVHFIYEWWHLRGMSEERLRLTVAITAVDQFPKATMPMWTYFILAIPSCFDLIATVLCMFGLMYISVSVYQLLRGACIVFVALMKHYVLKDRLKSHHWVGVGMLAMAISLVGLTSVLGASADPEHSDKNPMIGIAMILTGAFVQSLQYAFEEKMMTGEVSAPPLLVIGMEGLWGTVLCTLVLYPLAWLLPGDDHGHLEDPFNTWAMVSGSSTIQHLLVWYFVCIFLYNSFGVLVTYLLNSVWHAILDNFRPITVWGMDLAIFYLVSKGTFGEEWNRWSFLELGGLFILLAGTAVYNGSIRLPGFVYESGLSLATPLMARSPLLTAARDHARAAGMPPAMREKVVTQYVAPQQQQSSQYGFITVDPRAAPV